VLILQNVAFNVGQPWRRRDVEDSRRRLLNLGLFSSVHVEIDKEDAGVARTVIVEVRERDFRETEVGAGITTEQGPLAFVNGAHRNILGLGMVAQARVRGNWPYPMYYLIADPKLRTELLENRYQEIRSLGSQIGAPSWASEGVRWAFYGEGEGVLSLGIPRLLFLPFAAGLRGELVAARANRLSFSLNRAGLALTGDVTAPPFKYLRASSSPSVGVQVTALNCNTLEDSATTPSGADSRGTTCSGDYENLSRRLDNGVLALTTFRFPITVDGRDNIFKPHAGYLASGTVDAVLGGGFLRQGSHLALTPVLSTFFRVAGGLTGYLPLTRSWTLALGIRAGIIVPPRGTVAFAQPVKIRSPTGDSSEVSELALYVPLFERFYLGGPDSIRGFTPDGVLAADEAAAGSAGIPRPLVSQGGTAFWNTRSELRFPLADPLEGAVFLDAGQLFGDYTQTEHIEWRAYNVGVGFGVRFTTPVGPLVLDFGFALQDAFRGITEDNLMRRFAFHPGLGYF
jgi:outer membrane protein assembly factor BamA